MGGMVQFRRSAGPGGVGAFGLRMAITAAYAATTAMAAARPVTAGTRGMCGAMVVTVSSADKASRAAMTAAASTLSQGRDGIHVRGINTAATTIWCSAAVGVLAGAGYLPAAAIAAALILTAHLALRPAAYDK